MLTFPRKSKLVTNDDGVISAEDIITDSAPGIVDADFDTTLQNIAIITQTYFTVTTVCISICGKILSYVHIQTPEYMRTSHCGQSLYFIVYIIVLPGVLLCIVPSYWLFWHRLACEIPPLSLYPSCDSLHTHLCLHVILTVHSNVYNVCTEHTYFNMYPPKGLQVHIVTHALPFRQYTQLYVPWQTTSASFSV